MTIKICIYKQLWEYIHHLDFHNTYSNIIMLPYVKKMYLTWIWSHQTFNPQLMITYIYSYLIDNIYHRTKGPNVEIPIVFYLLKMFTNHTSPYHCIQVYKTCGWNIFFANNMIFLFHTSIRLNRYNTLSLNTGFVLVLPACVILDSVYG